MIHIVIGDDNRNYQSFLHRSILTCLKEIALEATIGLVTDNPNHIMQYASKHGDERNIYFLGIKYGKYKINGIALGYEIRRHDPFAYIVYITSYLQYVKDIFEYKLEALDFIYKEDSYVIDRITECLKVVKQEESRKYNSDPKKRIFIKSEGNYYNILLEDIIYIEASSHRKITIHTKNTSIECYDTLIHMEQKLNDDFLKVFRSYIVNLKYVKAIDKKHNQVIMNNDARCMISKPIIKEMEVLINREYDM